MLLAVVVAVLIPLTLCLWVMSVVLYVFHSGADVWEPISPFRIILSFLLPFAMANWGLRRKSLSPSGAWAGAVIGFVMTLSSYSFMASLLTFFVVGSKVTKWRSARKKALEADFKEGGQRDWLQVVCNGGVAAELAIVHMINSGCGEFVIDFQRRYTSSWLAIAILGALACSCGDTFASEVGSAVGSWSPRLITNMQRVPKGTNGAVSVVGTISSAIGGSVVGIAYFIVVTLCARDYVLEAASPPQLPIISIAAFAGLFGSFVDSLLGATLQYSGYDKERGYVVEIPRPGIQRISGTPLLDNHGVNLLSSVITAIVTPYFALSVWSHYA